ncbi:MAG: hypothetical protein ABSC38_02710 [Verrucomicrobiia bacterium]
MRQIGIVAGLIGTMLATGCATHVSVLELHREDLSAQSKVLAIEARNLEEMVLRQRTDASQEEGARALAVFRNEAEEFARTAAQWLSDDDVNTRYERLIEAWVKVKKTFPNMKADSLAQDVYQRVAHEWERLARVSGYAGSAYQRKIEQGS